MNEAERRLIDLLQVSSYIASFADPAKTIVDIVYYAYSVDKTGIEIMYNVPGDYPIIMDSDSEFIVTSLCGGARIAYPPVTVPPGGNRIIEYSPALNVQVTDGSSGKTYWNNPTPLPLIAGTGGFPYLFVNPRVIKPRTTLHIAASISIPPTITEQPADLTIDTFCFTMHGAKIYYAS